MRTSLLFSLTILLGACDSTSQTATAPTATAPAATAPSASASASASGLRDPIARYGDQTVTLAQLEAETSAARIKAEQELYEARSRALEGMINDALLDQEAKKQGTTAEELVAKATADVAVPDDAKVQDFFDKNKSRMRGDIEQNRPRIISFLQREDKQAAYDTLIGGLRDAAGVEVYLEMPRIPVTADLAPRLGPANAPVQIVEFSDFQCPYCSRAAKTIHEVADKYGDKVSIAFRQFPLPMHSNAEGAARASLCAQDQGKFWEMHDQLFENQRALDADKLSGYAKTVGLDTDAFSKCMAAPETQTRVEKDIADGKAVGMSGTPGFYINGRMLSGAQPIEAFSKVIDEELKAK